MRLWLAEPLPRNAKRFIIASIRGIIFSRITIGEGENTPRFAFGIFAVSEHHGAIDCSESAFQLVVINLQFDWKVHPNWNSD